MLSNFNLMAVAYRYKELACFAAFLACWVYASITDIGLQIIGLLLTNDINYIMNNIIK